MTGVGTLCVYSRTLQNRVTTGTHTECTWLTFSSMLYQQAVFNTYYVSSFLSTNGCFMCNLAKNHNRIMDEGWLQQHVLEPITPVKEKFHSKMYEWTKPETN